MGDATKDNLKFSELTQAVAADDLERVRTLIPSLTTRDWCRKLTKHGYPLLHEAVLHNRKEIFDYMLPYHDMIDLETLNVCNQTALQFVLNGGQRDKVDHFATALIEKGAYIHGSSKTGNLLHMAVMCPGTKVTKLLLSNGIDVNAVDYADETALLTLLYQKPRNSTVQDELVTALLCHGADPFIRSSEGYNAFELAIINDHSALIQETLFNYTYFHDGESSIGLYVLLKLAMLQSVFFHQVVQCTVRLPRSFMALAIFDLLTIHADYLKILLKNRSFCAVVTKAHYNSRLLYITGNIIHRPRRSISFLLHGTLQGTVYDFIKSQEVMTKIDLLLESSPEMNHHLLNFISELNCVELWNHIMNAFIYNETTATELMMFMFKNGLRCTNGLLHLVFSKYGYCELFKFLLTMDLDEADVRSSHTIPQNVIVSFICDPRLKLEEVLENFDVYGEMIDCPLLLKYFANRGFHTFLPSQKYDSQVPLLVEIARNMIRRHLMETFKLTNVKEFFSVVRALPICEEHKKIITFETPLYL